MQAMISWLILLIVAAVVLLVAARILQFYNLWRQAFLSGVKVGYKELIGMSLRKVNARTIVLSRMRAVKAGLQIATNQMETLYLAGGDVPTVVTAMIAANRAKIELPWDTACAIDLTGRDILEAVKTAVHPKVIDCPNPDAGGSPTIDAVAQDGIQLRAKARVTVRTHLARLIGGATQETLVARVREGIVTTIGSAQTHKAVLENPDHISKTVLGKGLDSGTAFEILSIDINITTPHRYADQIR